MARQPVDIFIRRFYFFVEIFLKSPRRYQCSSIPRMQSTLTLVLFKHLKFRYITQNTVIEWPKNMPNIVSWYKPAIINLLCRFYTYKWKMISGSLRRAYNASVATPSRWLTWYAVVHSYPVLCYRELDKLMISVYLLFSTNPSVHQYPCAANKNVVSSRTVYDGTRVYGGIHARQSEWRLAASSLFTHCSPSPPKQKITTAFCGFLFHVLKICIEYSCCWELEAITQVFG